MKNSHQISVQAWVWRSMIKTGIIPLILVEAVLVTIYLISNHFISSENMSFIRSQVNSELNISTVMESDIVRERILSISRLANIYRNETERVLSEDIQQQALNDSNLAISDSGVLYSKKNNGGAASYYSALTANENKDLTKIAKLARLDPLMKQIKSSDPFISAIYFNSWDSYNRIYPWFNTLEQYPPDMDIPQYNFYYLANQEYNPERNVVWTDVYIDPAGQGWMASAVAPVYSNSKLEGVVGLDITVDTIVKNIQNSSVPWDGYAILVSDSGNIMALPPRGEIDLNITELKSHDYHQTISEEVFKPEEFNLFKRQDTLKLEEEFNNQEHGLTKLVLNKENKLVSWATIPETNWKVLFVVDEEKMYEDSLKLKNKYQNIGYIMIMGLLGFYILFFVFTWFVSKRMSRAIAEPLAKIRNMFYQVSIGKFDISQEHYNLKELNDTASATIRMGRRLDKLTSQLKSAKVEAEEANMAKSRFISNVSHEIRTPMNSILALSDMLLKDDITNDQANSLRRIKKSGEHLTLVIDDVLDLSKIESGRLHIENIPFNVYSLVQDVYELFEPRIINRPISLDMQVAEKIPVLIGDPLRIKQILINYVSNAIKFTERGQVDVRVQASQSTDSKIVLRIEVADTGIGLSSDEKSKVFESFQQADTSTTRKYGGTGLGLTISRSIAQLMNGKLGVESTVNEGSTFWFEVELESQDDSVISSELHLNTGSIGVSDEQLMTDSMDCADMTCFADKLDYLTQLLEENNLEAEDYFFEHKRCFDLVVPNGSAQLAQSISCYDFSHALSVTIKIKAELIDQMT